MAKNIGLDILLLCDLVLPDWQRQVELLNYDSLKALVEDIYGLEVWDGVVFFGGIEALKNYWAQKRSQCEIEFSNYILEFFDEDYSVMKNYKFSSENKNNAN